MVMENLKGYVTFINNEVKENEKINEKILVYNSIEDSLRFTSIKDNKTITSVSVIGNYKKTDSKYYGYDDIIIANEIKINKILNYDDIIKKMLTEAKTEEKLCRFIQSFEINENDKELFSKKGIDVWLAVRYYQDGEVDVYEKNRHSLVKEYYSKDKNK